MNRDFNATYNYDPYCGGAGPSAEQCAAQNDLLLTVLQDLGMPAHIEINALCDEPEVCCNGHRVTFDRWGYTGTAEDGLDNADLNATVRAIVGGAL